MKNPLITVGRLGSRGRRRLQRGVTSIEYALVASLIAIVIIGSVSATGTSVLGLYDYVAERVQCAVSQNGCS